MPIAWGGYFPTLYTDALSAPYVDYAIRAQGEETLPQLVAALAHPTEEALAGIDGLSWKRNGAMVHNPNRAFTMADPGALLLREAGRSAPLPGAHACVGRRTAAHQASVGCRFRCIELCGVAAMFGGRHGVARPTSGSIAT